MELVYLWVEKYKNIKSQGFNFSPRFECKFHDEYDEKGNLKDNCKLEIIEKKEDEYIKDFFGDNINVTAIVGKNGSGKSSLLEYFLKLDEYIPHFDEFYNESTTAIDNFICIFYDGKGLYYMSNIEGIQSDLIQSEHIPFIRISYFKNNQDKEDDSKDLRSGNILLDKDRIIAIMNALYMSKYEFEFYPSHYLSTNTNFQLSTFMYVPNKIEIIPNDLKKVYDWGMGMFLKDALKEDRIELSDNKEKLFDSAEDDYHRFLIMAYLQKNDVLYDLEVLQNKKRLEYEYKKLEFDKYEKITEEDYNKYFSNRIINFNQIDDCERFIYFGKQYGNFFDYDLIDWKDRRYNFLSSGEQVIFGLLLNIFFQLHLKYNYQVEDEPHIIFLDEPDIYLHPNWQKKLINEIEKSFFTLGKNIHFIFTTHSPFLLSDIPKQNIIFLDTYKEKDIEVKEEKQEVGNCRVVPHDEVFDKKQTFGANIHTLLSDSFFMKDGLMGEFSKRKINEIIEFFDDKNERYSEDKERLYQIINTIGEPFLKEKLLFMYSERFPKTKEEQIAEYEAQIERLKSDD